MIGATERALHHYGSGINAIPVLSAYRGSPDNIYLLQVGIGAITGVLTSILSKKRGVKETKVGRGGGAVNHYGSGIIAIVLSAYREYLSPSGWN